VAAMSLFERAIAVDSEFSLAWAATARAAQFASIRGWTVAKRPPDSLLALAVRASRRALELDSTSAEAWTITGKVAGTVDLEDRAATFNALSHAIALDSNYAEAWFELGLAHEEALHPSEAERAWLRAVSLSPTNVQALSFLAYHYLWYGDYASGTRWADSAVVVEPTFFLARDASAFLALATRRMDVAIRHAQAEQRASGHEPPLPYCLIAAALARQGDKAGARRYAFQAESLASRTRPSKHEAVYLATAWTAIGDTARAIRWVSAYSPRADLHFQLHLKRDPELRWIATTRPALLTR
jgi:tetratricopeptide (TPR) repeat protein